MYHQQSNPCPHCKQPLTWSAINNQWYCNKCELFIQAGGQAPSAWENLKAEFKEFHAPAHQRTPVCPHCKAPCNLIPQYNRWYCYNCRQWL